MGQEKVTMFVVKDITNQLQSKMPCYEPLCYLCHIQACLDPTQGEPKEVEKNQLKR